MSPEAPNLFRFDEFELHPARRSLTRAGDKIPLAPKTFDVLAFLVANAGRVVLKEELLKAVWPESFVEDSNLTQHIFWLRKALTDRSYYVVTIPGRGYQFTAEVQTVAPSIPASDAALALPSDPTPASSRPTYWAYAVIIVIVCGLIGWGMRPHLNGATLSSLPGDHHEVVLADFENATGDPDFNPALKTLLSIDLDQSPYLVVASDTDTQKILQLMSRPADSSMTPTVAREVCQRLNDQVVLSGLIARFGQKYLLTLSATDCQSGKSLVESKSTADTRDEVLKSVDTLAANMRSRLGESIKSHPSSAPPLQLAHTFSLEALQQYSRGLALDEVGRQREAIPFLQRAVELDPQFAAAWLQLAISLANAGEQAASIAPITRAYALRDQGDEYLKFQITDHYSEYVTGDLHAVVRNRLAWTQAYPNQPQAWIDLASAQHDAGQFEDAAASARRALALEPNSPRPYSELAYSLLSAGHVEEAKSVASTAVQLHLDSEVDHQMLSGIGFMQHDFQAVAREAARAPKDDAGISERISVFTQGRAHLAVGMFLQSIEVLRSQGLYERAYRRQGVLLHRETDYLMHDDLRKLLPTVIPHGYLRPYNTILALAELGRIPEAEAQLKLYAAQINGTAPPDLSHDTMAVEFYMPQARAAIALAKHHPEEAIADLEPARPYDFDGLESLLLRARAYLAAGKAQLAESEFRSVLDHQYAAPGADSHPLAQLGLARALEMEGNHTAARQAYEALFILWKDADPDLKPLVQARAEYAKIASNDVKKQIKRPNTPSPRT
jgi:DNA-binding winged helix-turn-helix (wHTH) protein/tetratricopeptide (TPR) repeat protein